MILCKEEFAKNVDKAIFPGLQGGPHDNVTAAIGVCLHEASQPDYTAYCKQVILNAQTIAEEMIKRGFVVATGGTDNHMLLVDVTAKGSTGKKAQEALDLANIATNANMIPGDKRSAFDPSGIRFGTPAVTTRGLKEDEMRLIAHWIADVIEAGDDEAVIQRVRGEVVALCEQFPLWY
jgi:glycine hydroxymethyltransferase